MASLRFEVKGRKNPSHLYLRFYHSKEFEVTTKTGILINPNHWNNRLQRFKSIAENIPNKEEIIKRIEQLKAFIISEYNDSYIKGELITKDWLSYRINKFNNRPKHENDDDIFFVPFVEKYIKESETRINPNSGKPIDVKTIRKYNTTLSRLKEFELKQNTRLKHIDIGLSFFEQFVSFLSIDGNYSQTTISKYVGQVKMFCREAKVKGLRHNPEFESKRFNIRRSKPIAPYLNETEIDNIFNLEIKDELTDRIRDLFIIGLWTGLRVSDFSELNRLQIVGNDILISATEKTNAPATIPIHPQIKLVLEKRKGKFPEFNLTPKSLENLFNKKIKNICKDAGITEKIIGDLKNKETNRNVRGIYPKYMLVSSHICRRSFITNHLGKLPDRAIMTITTHSSIEQLHRYNRKSTEQYIEEVRQLWEKENKNRL